MKTLLTLTLICSTYLLTMGQVVNPFENNRNEFNQRDFISLLDVPQEGPRQQLFGYDWVEALNANSYSNIVELSDFEYSSEDSDGFITIETANFNSDDRDDIFYLMERDGMWTYGATFQEPELGEEDSLYHFLNPNLPDMVDGAILPSDHSFPCVSVGDFNGDGIDEVAVAWAQEEQVYLQIVTVTESGGVLMATPGVVFTDNEVSVKVNTRYTLSLGSGDLNEDGTDEIFIGSTETSQEAGVDYNAFVKVYDIESPENTPIPKGRIIIDNEHLGEDEELTDGELSAARTAVHGVRSFMTTSDEGVESIFAAFALERSNDFDSYDYLYSFTLEASSDLNSLTVAEGPVVPNNQGASFDFGLPCEVHRGDVNGDAQDDMVVLTSGYTIFSYQDGELYVANNDGVTPTMDSDPNIESNDLFDIGDVNRDGLDDIISQTKTYSTEPFGHHYWLQVYASDAEFNLENGGGLDFVIETGQTYTHYGFAVGNLDGNDLCLGEPTTFECDFYKPIIILECIPNHFDIVGETTYDLNNCYDFDNPEGCSNSVSFVNSIETTESQSVQVSSDWAVSGEVSSGFELGGFGMSSSLGYKYGEQFSNTESTTESLVITTTSNAIRDDFLRVQRFPFLMQKYPVLDATGDTVTYIVAAFPDPYEDIAPDDDNSRSLYNYIPNHEIGNILSYPRPDDEDLFYDKSEHDDWLIYEFGNQDINTGVTEEITLGTAAAEALEQSSTTTQTLSMGVGANGFGIGANLDAEFTETEMNVFGQTLSEAESYTIAPGQVTGGTNTWEYDIYPVLYWTKGKAAKLAMGVDLSQAGANWQAVYGQTPDPALNLPYRYEAEYNSDYQEELIDRTKSIYFDKFNPNPGDTVTAFIRVFNYSLMSMTAPVPFSLYNGNPADGAALIEDINGNTLFDSEEILENQGRSTVEVQFIVTNDMISDELNRIYIQLDPNNEIAETHESNNVGWVTLGLACNTPDGTVGIGEIELDEEEIRVNVFPNPGTDWVSLQFESSLNYLSENLQLRVSDLSGKVVSETRFVPDGSGTFKINVSHLPTGMYVYQLITSTEQLYSGKLIIR